jgi:hypothetical protein
MSETETVNTRLINTLTEIILTLSNEERVILMHQIQTANLNDADLETLKQEISIGVKQLQTEQYTEYDDQSLPDLLLAIKQRGRQRLEQERE